MVALVYVLLLSVKHALGLSIDQSSSKKQNQNKNSENILTTAWKGAIGNVGFYIFLALVFAFIKLMGWVDPIFQKSVQSISPPAISANPELENTASNVHSKQDSKNNAPNK